MFRDKAGLDKIPAEHCKYGSNNGYDGLYIEGTIANPTKIVIGEAKQWDGATGVMLNNSNGPLPIQMNDNWVQYVAQKLIDTGDPNKIAIGQMIQNPANLSKIEKYVTVVNQKTGDINILKLGSY